MTSRNLAYRAIGSLLVVVHSQGEASDPEWDQYMQHVSALRHRSGDSFQMLVYALGGAPTASQRSRLTTALGRRPVPLAVLSTSSLVRGVVTALSWFNPGIRSFLPTQLGDALRFLPAPVEPQTVLATVMALCADLNLPRPTFAEARP